MKISTTLFALALSGAVASAAQAPAVNADAAAIADFTTRINAYVALHQKVDATVPEPGQGARPVDYINHERAFAKAMQNARIGARQGDLFPRPMRGVVRRLLASVFRGPGGNQIKESIRDEFTGGVTVKVNAIYPEGAPFATVPHQILQGLPKLPSQLEYRFIGRRLVLMDAHGRLIVDYVDNVFP